MAKKGQGDEVGVEKQTGRPGLSAAPHVTEKHTYAGFSRGEAAWGIFWLSLGALVSCLLEVVYLGTWIAGIPVPYTIPIAFLFNIVLTRTAQLWSKNPAIVLIPTFVWVGLYFVLITSAGVTGNQFMSSSLRSILLLFAGIAGGVWPLAKRK